MARIGRRGSTGATMAAVETPAPLSGPATGGHPSDDLDPAETGLVMVDHGSRRAASNEAFEGFVASVAATAPWCHVAPAHMELAEPTIEAAVDECVAHGARAVIVCPYFLLPGRHWSTDIPALTAAAAERHPGLRWMVTAPVGLHPAMAAVVEATVEMCRSRVRGEIASCAACAGDGVCRVVTSGGPAA